MSSNGAVCKCSHSQGAHEHYRRGSDCAICGAEVCRRFRRDRWATVVQLIDPPAPNQLQDLPRPVPASAESAAVNEAPERRRHAG